MPTRSLAVLKARLEERCDEIEQTILARVYSISALAESDDLEYRYGIRGAASASVRYSISGIELGASRVGPPPPAVLAQARRAARSGVSLDTVLRRYLAGYTQFGRFVHEEAEREGLLRGPSLREVIRGQAAIFDRLVAAVTEEYQAEVANQTPASGEQRRLELVKKLLACELVDGTALQYELDGWHVGLAAVGHGATEPIKRIAKELDCRVLVVHPDEQKVWAWLGGRSPRDPKEVARLLSKSELGDSRTAIGEAGQGPIGWRATHRQAGAALPVARRGGGRVVRYAEVGLLASILNDELLATSFREIYLEPLVEEGDGRISIAETLRAYFGAGRQVSSTAAVLGVSRQTVAKRLRIAEERLGRPLDACGTELEVALRLEDLAEPLQA